MIQVPTLKHDLNELRTLSKFLNMVNGKELTSIHTPCYKPVMIKYLTDLKKYTGIETTDIKKFFDGLSLRYISEFKTITNEITAILMFGILYYSRLGRHDLAESFYILLAIRFYTNRVNQHWIKYCKNETWDLALNNLSQKHLFKVKKGISNSVYYLALTEYNKQKSLLISKKLTEEELLKIIYALRHRINQSVRSFANRYFDIEDSENKQGVYTTDEQSEISNINLLANNISERICTYSQIDELALRESITKSGIRRDLSKEIISEMSSIEYKDNIKFIIILISKIVNIKEICQKQPFIVRKIIQDRQRIGNYSIKQELLNMTNTMGIYGIKNVNKDQIAILLTNYLTLYIKNRTC